MDAKRMTHSAWLYALAIAISLGNYSWSMAGEALASDSGDTSTIFISDDEVNAPPQLPSSVSGDLVIVGDQPAADSPVVPAGVPQSLPTVFTAPTKAARGELRVVTNPHLQGATPALRPLTASQPVASPMQQAFQQPIQQQPIQQLPVQQLPVQSARGTIQLATAEQPIAAPVPRELAGDIQIAIHAEPAPLASGQSAAELLIEAHQLSFKAESAAQFTQIIQACATAMRAELEKDQLAFAQQLSSWALNRRGQLRADAGEYDLADADFQAAVDANSRNWRALHNRGVSYAQTQSFAEAFDDFNAVIQLNPEYAKAYANRATLYVQAKDLESAVKDYEQAIARDTKFASAYVGLGRVLHMLGRWDEALDRYNSAIEFAPERADFVCSRGDLQADMGRYGEALADYARTIEIDPEFAHAYRNGAWLLATCPDERFRDPKNAVLGAQQALEYSYGDRHVALDTLAAALASNGQFEEAITTVTEAVDLAPEDAKFTYLERRQLYQEQQPFRTEPTGNVAQVVYEASDQ